MGLIIDSSLSSGRAEEVRLGCLLRCPPQEVPYMAVITASELLHGVERARPEHRAARSLRVEQFIASVEVIDFDLAVARRYAALWAALQRWAPNRTPMTYSSRLPPCTMGRCRYDQYPPLRPYPWASAHRHQTVSLEVRPWQKLHTHQIWSLSCGQTASSLQA